MEKFDLGTYVPNCVLAHRLTNKLSVIVGYCDLLRLEVPEEESSKCLQRLLMIRDIAKEMAAELNEHQCCIDAAIKSAAKKPAQKTDSTGRRQRA